jgi:hypothetical protein
MRKALVLLAALALSSLAGVQPSRAQFDACTSEYLTRFEAAATPDIPAWSPGEIECVEYFRFSFSTPGGERWIRGIGDINVSELAAPGAVAAVERGARLSAQRMEALGNYRIANTTILMAFDVSNPAELADDPVARREAASAGAWTTQPTDLECLTTVFLLGDARPEGEIPFEVAHELFHCVQKSTLSPEQNATTRHGAWWIEGSALWFAAAAIGEQMRWDAVGAFASSVGAGLALHDMSYEMAVFFYWLDQTRGDEAIMPFLSGMANEDSAAAQQAAMRDQLSDEDWLRFAQDYLDGEITYPSGGQIPRPSIEGDVWTISASGEQRRPLATFVIAAGWADFHCGQWDNEGNDVNAAVREESSRDWSDWPTQVDARDRGNVRYRMVALNTREDSGEQELDSRRSASCTSCLARTVIDQCLVGRWRLTGGGPQEWLRNQGIPFTRMEVSTFDLTMNEDGTYSTGGFSSAFRAEYPDMAGGAEGTTQATSGRWSAEEGQLSGCVDGGGESSGVAHVESRGGIGFAPYSRGGPAGASGSTAYTCSDTTFTTEFPMSRGGPMRYEFTRQTPPPRRR